MHIQLETPDKNTIRSYSDTCITVGETPYQHSVIISKQAIVSDWAVHSVQDLNETNLAPILQFEPEVILIGHTQLGVQIPMAVMQYLSKLRVGIECMSIGAASRTFNVLLSEHRQVVVGIVFKT